MNMYSRVTPVTYVQQCPLTLAKPHISSKRYEMTSASTCTLHGYSPFTDEATVSVAYVFVEILVIFVIIIIDSFSVNCHTFRFEIS